MHLCSYNSNVIGALLMFVDDDEEEEVRELVTMVRHKGLNRRRSQSLGRRDATKHGRMISKTAEMENF